MSGLETYGSLLVTIVIVIIFRIYSFRKKQGQSLKYYTHPKTLAQDVIDFNVKKNKNNSDYNKLVDPDSLSGLVHYNIKLVEIEFDKKEQEFIGKISERLRNACMYIFLVINLKEKEPKVIKKIFSLTAAKICMEKPKMDEVYEFCKDEKNYKKYDKFLLQTNCRYIEHINEELEHYGY